MYFSKFPQVVYSLDGKRSGFIITDLFRRVVAVDKSLLPLLSYDEHDISDDETPEILAARVYENPQLHWIILITNNIIDPRFEWPMSTNALNKYVTNKYGAGNEYAVHHYINSDNDIVHSSYTGLKYPVSNFDYENNLNESKRRIKLLKPQFVTEFIKLFESKINGR